MNNGDFIRSMTDEDITENLTPGICDLSSTATQSDARTGGIASVASKTG